MRGRILDPPFYQNLYYALIRSRFGLLLIIFRKLVVLALDGRQNFVSTQYLENK